jgi:uncharacterized repeat protein (TIGR03803 family)
MRSIKTICLSAVIFSAFQFLSFKVKSQDIPEFTLWGTSSNIGKGNGSVFSIQKDGSGFTQSKIFEGSLDGANPQGAFLYNSGYLYGMTYSGGANDLGAIIKVKPDGTDYQVIHSFDFTGGASPRGNLTLGTNGKIYGMTNQGGAKSTGVIFSLETDGTAFTKLLDFNTSTTGSDPIGSLLQASDGMLYGTTINGGVNNSGVLFKINADGTNYTTILNFSKTETGFFSQNDLIEGTDGFLYILTNRGGANNTGVIFKVMKDGSNYTKLMDIEAILTSSNYSSLGPYWPSGSLMQASNGKLYGVNPIKGDNGKGSIFRIETDGENYTELIQFDGTNGSGPIGSLFEANDGMLYGLAEQGGANDLGVIYKLNLDGTNFIKLFDFDGTTTGKIFSGSPLKLTQVGAYLFGTTSADLSSNNGSLYRISLDGAFTKFKEFPEEFTRPAGQLLLASDGYLYGLAGKGGPAGVGGIYKIKSDGTEYATVYSFDKLKDGFAYGNSLIEDTDGYLYGMTYGLGSNGLGVIFKIKKDGTGFEKLLDFNGSNGGTPMGALTRASNGLLYGVGNIFNGAAGDGYYGLAFRIAKDGSGYQKLIDFNNESVGISPYGTLVQASDGNLYGVNAYGGTTNEGVIFKMDLDGNNYGHIVDFEYGTTGPSDGYGTKLIQGPDGYLYAMTSSGGAHGKGTLFKVQLNGSDFTKLFDFTEGSGGAPRGGITFGPDGLIYGASKGGANNLGFLFKMEADGSGFEKLHDFILLEGFSIPGALTIVPKGKSPQSISFNPLPSKTYEDANFNLSATSNSGLPITYSSSNAAVATISGDSVTIVGAGTTTITASQSGDYHYLPAINVEQVLTVNKASQTITFPSLPGKTFGDAAFNLDASSSSGLPISYTSSNPGKATITDKMITILSTGDVTITASQAGNENYLPAEDVNQNLIIHALVINALEESTNTSVKVYPNPASQSITISLPNDNLSKRLIIYSAEGKSIEHITTNEASFTVPLFTYGNGYYLIQVFSGDKQFLKRFIKK